MLCTPYLHLIHRRGYLSIYEQKCTSILTLFRERAHSLSLLNVGYKLLYITPFQNQQHKYILGFYNKFEDLFKYHKNKSYKKSNLN